MEPKKSKLAKFSNKFIISAFSLIIILLITSIIYNIITKNSKANISEQAVTLIISTLFLSIYVLTRNIFTERFSYIPDQFYFIAMTFAFFSTYLGSYLNFYEAFTWWDDALHFSSGILIALFSIVIVSYSIGHRFGKYKSKSDIVFLVIIGCLLSLSIAVFWEFYEFCYDYIVDGNMQRGSILIDLDTSSLINKIRPSGRIVGKDLLDTMNDMFLATIGAIIAGIYSYKHFARLQIIINKEKDL
ncbi:MAG: hypothetical protein ACK5NF_02105 [Bacilli bacterium]